MMMKMVKMKRHGTHADNVDADSFVPEFDGGSKSRPEMYSLAVKQILAAVGNDMEYMTKDNVRQLQPQLTHFYRTNIFMQSHLLQ
jgi:hypothetical protein